MPWGGMGPDALVPGEAVVGGLLRSPWRPSWPLLPSQALTESFSMGTVHAVLTPGPHRGVLGDKANERVCERGEGLVEEARQGEERRPFSRRAKIPATQNLGMFLLEAEEEKNVEV